MLTSSVLTLDHRGLKFTKPTKADQWTGYCCTVLTLDHGGPKFVLIHLYLFRRKCSEDSPPVPRNHIPAGG